MAHDRTEPGSAADQMGAVLYSWQAEGADPGRDVEAQADALGDAATGLDVLLLSLASQPRRSLDAIAVFRRLSEAADGMARAAGQMHRQEWFDMPEDAEAREAWDAAVTGLRAARDTFKWVSEGWI